MTTPILDSHPIFGILNNFSPSLATPWKLSLYAQIATNLDIGADLSTENEDLVEISINQDDEILAMGIKLRISKILLVLIQSEHTRTRANMLGKFFRLDIKVTRFILLTLRQQHSGMVFPEEAEDSHQSE